MAATGKRHKLFNAAADYLRKVGRKKQKGLDPNDRHFDRRFEQKLKRMAPEDVDALFRGDMDSPADS